MQDFESYVLTSNDKDPELGFIPALMAAIPAAASLAGSLIGGGKKGGGGGKSAVDAGQVLGALQSAIGGDDKNATIDEVVRNIVKTVPSPVVNEVKKAIAEMRNAADAQKQGVARISSAVDAQFGPQIAAMLAALKAQAVQRQATYEHNKLASEAKTKRQTNAALKTILRRLQLIEARLGNAAVVPSLRRAQLLGGRAFLEGR